MSIPVPVLIAVGVLVVVAVILAYGLGGRWHECDTVLNATFNTCPDCAAHRGTWQDASLAGNVQRMWRERYDALERQNRRLNRENHELHQRNRDLSGSNRYFYGKAFERAETIDRLSRRLAELEPDPLDMPAVGVFTD